MFKSTKTSTLKLYNTHNSHLQFDQISTAKQIRNCGKQKGVLLKMVFKHFLYCMVFFHVVVVVLSVTGEWSSCKGVTGICIDTHRYSCSSSTITNKCRGPHQVRCCPWPYGVKSRSCSQAHGLCRRTGQLCSGTIKTGLCPGPYYVKCCSYA